MHKKYKIRKLECCQTDQNEKETSLKLTLKFFAISFVLSILFIYIYTSKIALRFAASYLEQYNAIVHGRTDYCYQDFDYKTLIRNFEKNIIGQSDAIAEVERKLKQHENFTSIILLGTAGVGKTLLISLFGEHFTWRSNVRQIVWSEEEDRMATLRMEHNIRRLTNCGHNLILVDNLQPNQDTLIENFNRKAIKMVEQFNVKVLLIYSITTPQSVNISGEEYKKRLSLSHKSYKNETQVVKFREFNKTDLENCVNHECNRLNISFNRKMLHEIELMIDVTKSGCKKVRSKLLLYKEYD